MNTQQLKKLAGRIRVWLETASIPINHSESLDQSSAIVGLRNWPEVQAFPDQVRDAKLDLAAAIRLCRRLKSKYDHTADPQVLFAALEQAMTPVVTGVRAGDHRPFNSLTSAWLSVAASQGLEGLPSPGHAATLLAAAFGYDSVEEYDSEGGEVLDFSMARFWIIDVPKLRSQIERLGLELDEQDFLACLKPALSEIGGPSICAYPWDLLAELQQLVDDAVVDDSDVAGQMATTNCVGAFYTDLEFDPVEEPLPLIGDEVVIGYSGTVNADDHLDAPFCGDTVEVTGNVTMTMLGRRICGATHIAVLSAELDWSWAAGGDESGEDDEAPTFSRTEALARELNLTPGQGKFVAEAEITQATTSAGVPNGYLVDLTNCESSEVVEQLLRRHGSSEIWVLGASFDHIRHEPWA